MGCDNKANLFVANNATGVIGATWTDSLGALINLTGYTMLMQLRLTANTPDPAMLELSTDNGKIVLADQGTATGQFTITISAADAATLEAGVYDLLATSPGGVVTRLMYGDVSIGQGVTRVG